MIYCLVFVLEFFSVHSITSKTGDKMTTLLWTTTPRNDVSRFTSAYFSLFIWINHLFFVYRSLWSECIIIFLGSFFWCSVMYCTSVWKHSFQRIFAQYGAKMWKLPCTSMVTCFVNNNLNYNDFFTFKLSFAVHCDCKHAISHFILFFTFFIFFTFLFPWRKNEVIKILPNVSNYA